MIDDFFDDPFATVIVCLLWQCYYNYYYHYLLLLLYYIDIIVILYYAKKSGSKQRTASRLLDQNFLRDVGRSIDPSLSILFEIQQMSFSRGNPLAEESVSNKTAKGMEETSRPSSPKEQEGKTERGAPEKKCNNNGVSRKIRGTGYPSEAQLERYRRRIRVELVRDKKDEFGRNFWGKQEETKRIFSCSGNHNLHVRAVCRFRPLLWEEEEGEEGEVRGDGEIPHFDEDGLEVLMPNIDNGRAEKYTRFSMQGVYGSYVDQTRFYECFLPPILRSFLSGGCGSFIVHGARGSGKKYTMFGPEFWENWGTNVQAELEGIEEESVGIVSRPGTAQSRPGTAQTQGTERPLSRGTNMTRPASRQSVASSVPSSMFTNFPGDPTAMATMKATKNIPDGDDTDGMFPRSIRYIYREANRRLIQEQTAIEVYLSVVTVCEDDPCAYDMLGLNPAEPKSMRWNPKEETFWPEDLVTLRCRDFESCMNTCYSAVQLSRSLYMPHSSMIFLVQCTIGGISDRWDARGDRLPEGLERKGKLFFVKCDDSDSGEWDSTELYNLLSLRECLAKARSNAFPTGKPRLVLPIRSSTLTQILSGPLQPGQMVIFAACASTSLINYRSTFRTCQTVDFIHTANRASNLDENSMLKRKPVKKKEKVKTIETEEERLAKKVAAEKREVARLKMEKQRMARALKKQKEKEKRAARKKAKAKRKNEELQAAKAEKAEKDALREKCPMLPILAKPMRLSQMLNSPSKLIEARRLAQSGTIGTPPANDICLDKSSRMYFGGVGSQTIIYPPSATQQNTKNEKNNTAVAFF